MSVFDTSSQCSFLVDSGADISVLPLSFLNSKSKIPVPRPGQRLRAANGSFIDTFGTKSLILQLPGFSARHSFRVARVAQPILGADFFRKHSLLIDVKKCCLRLPDGRIIDSKSSSLSGSAVSAIKPSYPDILADYPSITKPSFEPDHLPAHGVQHVVPTSGPPVFARARPLFADKLSVAKAEFDKMLSMQIIRPSVLLGLLHFTWCRNQTAAGVRVGTFTD